MNNNDDGYQFENNTTENSADPAQQTLDQAKQQQDLQNQSFMSVAKDGKIVDGGSHIQGSLMEKKTAADQGFSKIDSSHVKNTFADQSMLTNPLHAETLMHSAMFAAGDS